MIRAFALGFAAGALTLLWLRRPRSEPLTLACGCLDGEHPATIEAIRERHPEITIPDWGWDGGAWYFTATSPPSDPYVLSQAAELLRRGGFG